MMKKSRQKSNDNDHHRQRTGGIRRKRKSHRGRDDDHVNELLKLCLQKVCELQAEIGGDVTEERDAEAEGYAACAMETLRFLSNEGLSDDHPVVRELTDKLMGERNDDGDGET